MRIVHIDFTGPFTDTATYQENLLAEMNANDGHEVTLIVENTYWEGSIRKVVRDSNNLRYTLKSGVDVVRLPYRKFFNFMITDKVRMPIGLKEELYKIKPDIIFIHCLQTMASEIVLRYVKKNQNTCLVADTHTDHSNSALTFLSRHILHGIFYKKIARDVVRVAKRVYYLSPECKDFLLDVYNIESGNLEYLPLGGVIPTKEEKKQYRISFREKYGIDNKDIVYFHSGKIDKLKKTLELIKYFTEYADKNAKLFIAGDVSNEIREEFNSLVGKDSRIFFMGWIDGRQLFESLCGADVYLQPGSQSATAQVAICCGLPIVVRDFRIYQDIVRENGWRINEASELKEVFYKVNRQPEVLIQMGIKAEKVASEMLDYKRQARKYLKYATK